MFTGLVEEIGVVAAVNPAEGGRLLRVRADLVLEDVSPGDSLCVDGACHTVTTFDREFFEVHSIGSTLQRTTVGEFAVGRRVNLERAMKVGSRLGGHMVQGHVDGVGQVVDVREQGDHVLIDAEMPEIVSAVTVLHGSITVNGVSLTVNEIPRPGIVQVSIIPHTLGATNLGELTSGSRVNMEGDLIGKYVRQLLGMPGSKSADNSHVRQRWGYQP